MSPHKLLCLFLFVVLFTGCGTGSVPETSQPPASEPPPIPSPTPVPEFQAKVVDVVNLVDAHALSENPWEPALPEMSIFPGGEVWAREASTARVGLGDSLIRVAPNTVFTLNRPDEATGRLNLEEGQIWLNIEGLEPGEKFEVETPWATASVRGTRFSVRVLPDGTTVLSVVKGDVSFEAGGVSKLVSAGFESTVPPGGVPSDPAPITFEEQLRWGNAQGEKLNEYFPAADGSKCSVEFQGSLTTGNIFDPQNSVYVYRYYDPSQGSSSREFHAFNLSDCGPAALPGYVSLYADYFALSPAGDQVAFSDPQEGVYKICTASLSGQDKVCFGPDAGGGKIYNAAPQWSSDGQWLVFMAEYYELNQAAVYKARPDGSELTRLTGPDTGFNSAAAFSPDGGQVAYARYPDPQDSKDPFTKPSQLWLMNADGSDNHKLLDGILSSPYTPLAWSPDGKMLAVQVVEGQGLAFVRPDGTVTIVPAAASVKLTGLHWSPTPTGWPFFYQTTRPETTTVRDMYVLGGPEQEPNLFLSDVFNGPYWSADASQVLIGRRITLDQEKRLYTAQLFLVDLTFGYDEFDWELSDP